MNYRTDLGSSLAGASVWFSWGRWSGIEAKSPF